MGRSPFYIEKVSRSVFFIEGSGYGTVLLEGGGRVRIRLCGRVVGSGFDEIQPGSASLVRAVIMCIPPSRVIFIYLVVTIARKWRGELPTV